MTQEIFKPSCRGWQPSLPDYRDYGPSYEHVRNILDKLRRPAETTHASSVDLREFFPPVRDQLGLNTSPAHAAVALVEYFWRRATGKLTEGSVRFVYRMSQKLLRLTGDSTIDLRTTLKAIARFGIPPADFFPYDVQCFDDEPDAFLYKIAEDDCESIIYVRIDERNTSGSQLLHLIKAFLHAGFPITLGFSVPGSLTRDPDVPWCPETDSICGGHAVVAVGYDDRRVRSTKGALLIRNSWGGNWGENGYGWLPYRFVEHQLVGDCWTVINANWLNLGDFPQPIVDAPQKTARGPRSNVPR